MKRWGWDTTLDGTESIKTAKQQLQTKEGEARRIEQEERQDLEFMICHKDTGMNPQILMAWRRIWLDNY